MGSVEASASKSVTTQKRAASDSELRAYVVAHLDEALENGWVKPYFQPVIRTITGKLCGFEALARWEDPTYGLLSPAVFIPALEEAKLIHLLDCGIIRQVCKLLNSRRNNRVPIVPVSFNLSRLDFDLCDVFAVVEHAAHEFGVPRRMLNIEITESLLGSDPAYMTVMMRTFHDAGYEVWMDDFGSGYSSLNVLKDFEFDELKIDMAFLSCFSEKSKTVLASIVDMAKKLGIQTLAEGVETEEHCDFLRSIGCEKMQGYLFGKPEPLGPSDPLSRFAERGIEALSEYRYINEMGSVNMLSLSEHDLTANSSASSYSTSMPIAIVEYYNDRYRIVVSNDAFRDSLARLGVSSVEKAERLSNDMKRPFARQTRNFMHSIAQDKVARFDYAIGDAICVIRARHIASWSGRIALILSFGDTVAQKDQERHDRMNDLAAAVYSIYDLVNIIHLDERFSETVFDNIGSDMHSMELDFDSAVRHYAECDIYEDDRQRYLDFLDHDTMLQRIEESGEDYLTGFFRLRQRGGNYAWKLFSLMRLGDLPGNQVMLCIRSTHWQSDDLLHRAYGKHQEDGDYGSQQSPSGITDGSLWRAIAHGKFVRLFWKDTDRRFIGANQAFLDYYGFGSVDEIIGKTDEDMGWHVNPEPFMEDELRVLNEGHSIENAFGHCIANGEMRDIVANKRPIYRNGRIVGLVGYFIDVDDGVHDGDLGSLSLHDELTGLLGYIGLEASTWKFVDAYKRQGIDFAMISVNIDNIESISNEFGSEFGDKALKRVAEELLRIAGHQRVIGRVFANRFVILGQGDSDEELQRMCDEIERTIMGIAHVDGTPCTMYALAGFTRFSEHGDIEAMKRFNRERRVSRRDKWTGKSGEEDIITSASH